MTVWRDVEPFHCMRAWFTLILWAHTSPSLLSLLHQRTHQPTQTIGQTPTKSCPTAAPDHPTSLLTYPTTNPSNMDLLLPSNSQQHPTTTMICPSESNEINSNEGEYAPSLRLKQHITRAANIQRTRNPAEFNENRTLYSLLLYGRAWQQQRTESLVWHCWWAFTSMSLC
jgi:hypothetical protein